LNATATDVFLHWTAAGAESIPNDGRLWVYQHPPWGTARLAWPWPSAAGRCYWYVSKPHTTCTSSGSPAPVR